MLIYSPPPRPFSPPPPPGRAQSLRGTAGTQRGQRRPHSAPQTRPELGPSGGRKTPLGGKLPFLGGGGRKDLCGVEVLTFWSGKAPFFGWKADIFPTDSSGAPTAASLSSETTGAPRGAPETTGETQQRPTEPTGGPRAAAELPEEHRRPPKTTKTQQRPPKPTEEPQKATIKTHQRPPKITKTH